MNNYELMVIFTPVLSDDEFKAEQKKYAKLVTDAGGSIVAENPWGLKSLAYPIQKKTTGLYWVMEYTCLLYTSPSPRDRTRSRMPSSA